MMTKRRKKITLQAARWLREMQEMHQPSRQWEFLLWLRQSPEHIRELLLAAAVDAELRAYFRERPH